MVWWLSKLHNFIQQSLNSGSVQVQILLATFWRFGVLKTSDRGLGRKKSLMPLISQSFCKNNSSLHQLKNAIRLRLN